MPFGDGLDLLHLRDVRMYRKLSVIGWAALDE